jgi:hypothetical protein
MQVRRALPEVLQFPGGAHMIKVAVGMEQCFNLETVRFHAHADAIRVAPGIHYDAATGLGIPGQYAIAADGTN